jgi:hypothetical protein
MPLRWSPRLSERGWSFLVDRKLAAEKIRALLEGRIARLLGCDVGDLHSMKIGSMAHFLFLLIGDSEVMPGFNVAMVALRDLIGFELMWSVEKVDGVEQPEEKPVVN